jgi:hypothetical protein
VGIAELYPSRREHTQRTNTNTALVHPIVLHRVAIRSDHEVLPREKFFAHQPRKFRRA